MTDKKLTVLLTCFPGVKAAGAARRPLETRLTGQGDGVLQTSVLQVTANRRTSIHDPHRAVRGMWTSALTWGAFGLVAGTNRLESALIWAVLGALCGGVYAYLAEHLLKKDELQRLGQHLPASSSALLTFARAADASRLLEATAPVSPSAASAVTIGPSLETRAYAGATDPIELPHASANASTGADQTTLLTMILTRYPDPTTAARVAKTLTGKHGDPRAPQVELVVETLAEGRRRVSDPAQGVAAMSRSDVISWGGFGLVFGAIVGLVGGGGLLGFLEDGLVTGVAWAVFGLAAGALYGLWAGRSISARRLTGIGEVLPAGSSAILAWGDGSVGPGPGAVLEAPGIAHAVLCFNPVPGGAVLATR